MDLKHQIEQIKYIDILGMQIYGWMDEWTDRTDASLHTGDNRDKPKEKIKDKGANQKTKKQNQM